MFDDPLIAIKNINKMSKHIGRDIAKKMEISLSEFKYYIKPKEIRSIIRQYAIHKNENLLINACILQKVFDTISQWVIGIQISKLASEDKMEVYWDDDKNCPIFKNKE
jgi:hypothetical protein